MGTRSLVRFVDEGGSEILCLFRHYDGYPAGRGTIIRDFMAATKFRDFDTWPVRFVAFELAQHVAANGGTDDGLMLRCFSPRTKLAETDCEYEYVIRAAHAIGNARAVYLTVRTTDKAIFDGDAEAFKAFIDAAEQRMKDRIAASRT